MGLPECDRLSFGPHEASRASLCHDVEKQVWQGAYGQHVLRDRNLLAIQADLLAGWATGIRSVVALTGDAMTIKGDSPDRKGVFEVNWIGFLNVINTLNSGKDLAGNELKGKTDYLRSSG